MPQLWTASWKSPAATSAGISPSIRCFCMENCPSPSAAASVSPVCACCCLVRVISARYRSACGTKRLCAPVKKPASHCCNLLKSPAPFGAGLYSGEAESFSRFFWRHHLPKFFLFHNPEAYCYNKNADGNYRRIAIFPCQLRHPGKIHAIPSCQQ